MQGRLIWLWSILDNKCLLFVMAVRAGVHPSTVSRVFSGKAKISEDTRDRVFEAATRWTLSQCHCPFAECAAHLYNRRCCPHIFPGYFEDAFFPQVMRGLLDVAYQHGYRVLVGGSSSFADEITQTFEILGSRQADGIVVLSNRLDVDTVGALRRQETPFVLIGRPPENYSDVPWWYCSS